LSPGAQGRIELHPAGDADHRRQAAAGGAREHFGLVYYVSITGITGAAAPDADKVHAAVTRIKRHTQLPVAVGFGVRTAKQTRAIASGAEGVVVGSALVNAVKEASIKRAGDVAHRQGGDDAGCGTCEGCARSQEKRRALLVVPVGMGA